MRGVAPCLLALLPVVQCTMFYHACGQDDGIAQCPTTFKRLFALLEAGTPCLFVPNETKRAQVGEDTDSYYFNNTALCEPGARNVSESSGLYVRRRGCAAGFVPISAKNSDTLDTICVECAPGKFRTGLDPLESSCQDKKDACSGSVYDTTAPNERTRDRNCTQEEALRSGVVPECASATDTYTYSEQRYHRVTRCAPPSQHAQCQGVSHAQSVLLYLWKEAGFELPVVHDQPMLRGFSSGNITCLMSCNAGYAESNGTCVACGAGKYKKHSGEAAVQVLAGGAGREDKQIGQRWYKHEPCVECAAGTYQAFTGQSSCLECPEDYFCAHGAADKTRCAVLGAAADPPRADICDPNTMYMTATCAKRSTQKNCALCPNSAETHRDTWEHLGHVRHCGTAECPDGTCADSECPDGQHFANGACTNCTAHARAPCAHTAGAEFLNTGCNDGLGFFCEVCSTIPGKRLLRSPDNVCRQECDDEPDANGFIFLTPARVRELGATPEIEADACQKARANVLNCDIETVEMRGGILQCTEPPKCIRKYLVEHVPRNERSSACGCLMGLWGRDEEGCSPCPTHMTSLPGTTSVEGCFCRAGYAELSGLSTGNCRPCGHDQEYGRTHYCPGGFSNYSRDIAPYRLPHARGGESVRLCAGGTEPEHGRCRCPGGTPNVHDDFQFASSSRYCSLPKGMRIDANTGNTTNCEPLPLVEFTDECNWVCVERAVKADSGHGCECATGAEREENACVCKPGYYMQAGECVPCPANHFCTGGRQDKKKCQEDRSSPLQTVREEDCRCRAGYYFYHIFDSLVTFSRCYVCPRTRFCQPRCFTIGTAASEYGNCVCPDFFKCHEAKQDRPYACNKGEYYEGSSCHNGAEHPTDVRLWHNGLNDTAHDRYTSINPMLSDIIQDFNFSGSFENGVYVLADVAFVCGQRRTLVALNPTALLHQHGVQFACAETPGRVNAGHSVPSWLYDGPTHAYTLVHELYKEEELPVLTSASAHLAWSQVLSCASTTTAEVLSEIDACYHDAFCPQGLALQRADAPAGSLPAGSLPAGSLLVALGPQTHRAWGLPLGATCVGATRVQPAAGLHFAVHCVAPDGVHFTHEHSTVRLRAESGTGELYAWTSLVVEPWQYSPARYHGQRMVLSVLCGRDSEEPAPELALHTIIGGGRGYATRIKLEAAGADARSSICSGVRPAHVVDRWKQRLYLFGESELLSIDIASIDVDTHSRGVHQIHHELPNTPKRRAAWLYDVPYGSLDSENRRGETPRALAVLSIVQESVLELHWWDTQSSMQNKTLALPGAIVAALQANMNAQPMRAVWKPFAGSTFELDRVISLNSEAQDLERPLPLDVLAHGTLAQSSYAIAVDAQVLLRFAQNGTLQLARLLHLTPGAGSVYGLEYQWVPFSHGAHDNVLQVQGRVLIAFGTRTAALHTLAVAHFGCAECEKHERWDADDGGCVCEKGSLAVCEPCTVPLGCNPHRTVYNTSASGCTVATRERADGSDAVVYQQRCAGCGEGGPFYCPNAWTQTPCPPDRPVSLSTTGLSHTSVACQCPAMFALLPGHGGRCAPCPREQVCTPDSSEQRCPANAGAKLEPASPPERPRKRVECQCIAGFEQTSQIHEFHGKHMQSWPPAFINTSDPPGTDVVLVACRRTCPAHAICDQDNISTACADNYKIKQGGGCEKCNRTEVCRGGDVTQCHGPPAPNATGAVRFCPCQNNTEHARGAQTWRPTLGCTSCRAGHYCDEHGGEHACPANTASRAGSPARSECQCKPGFYSAQGSNESYASCAECPPGSYCPGAGAGMQQCGDGKDSPPRASSVADCFCRDPQKKGESCDRCRELTDGERACRSCADPAVATYRDGDTDECTDCQPGFWRSNFDNSRKIHAQLFQHGLLQNPFADEFRNAWAQYEKTPAAACRVCPPLFWCSGGNARPELLPDLAGNTSSFTLLPAGGESPKLSFPCPAHSVERGERRGTRGYGLSSCFQEASTWDGRALAEQVHDKHAPGVVHIDPAVHGSSLISALINQDRTQVLELIDYVDLPNPPWTFTRLASGTYEFVFEIDVVALAQQYLVDVRKLLKNDVLTDDADVWAATLMPSLWALHNNHKRSSTSRLQGAAQVVVGHLAHNRRAAALARKVAAAVARQLNITAPPPTPEFRLGAESLPELTEATARARLGAMHYVWRQESVLLVATYQAAALHAAPPAAAPPPPTTVLSPDMAAECSHNTVPIRASLGSSVVRVCMACLHGYFFHDAACQHCTSVFTTSAEKTCSNQKKDRGFTEPCTWNTGRNICHECTRGKCCAHCLSDTTYNESITEVDDNCLQLRFEPCV